MPLTGSGTVLTAGMKTKIEAAGLSVTDDAFLGAMAEALLEHIVANAVVNTVVATTGSPTAQTGTGVGTLA